MSAKENGMIKTVTKNISKPKYDNAIHNTTGMAVNCKTLW